MPRQGGVLFPSRERRVRRQRGAVPALQEEKPTANAQDEGAPVVLRLDGVTKRFGPLVANDAISFDLQRGEVIALLGENGAGKTTLMNILFGHYVADEGSVEAFGRALPPGDPRAALDAGIGMVHQHFTLADNMSVLENIALGTQSFWKAALRPRRGAPTHRRTVRRLRPRRRSRRDRRLAVGRRAPAGRDPEGALPRRHGADPRRADGRADARRDRRAVPHAEAAGRAGPVDHLHLAQAE